MSKFIVLYFLSIYLISNYENKSLNANRYSKKWEFEINLESQKIDVIS